MRVLLLGPWPPPFGGVQTHLVALRDTVRSRGDECRVVNITRHRRPDHDDVFFPSGAISLLRLLFTSRPDIVHLHVGGILPLRVLLLAMACTVVPGARACFTFHSGGYPTSPEGRRRGRWTLRGLVLRRFAHVISVNGELDRFFAEIGVSAARRHIIAPHALPAISDSPPPHPALDGFMGTHSPVLLSVGLLESEYDLETQIAAFESVAATLPNAGLALVGSGSLEAALRGRIASSPVRTRILLTGDVPHARTLAAIRDCSMLLRTTRYDGDAISVREALHFGTPVIATETALRPDGVHLVPVESPKAVAEGIFAVLARQPAARTSAGTSDTSNIERVVDLYAD